MVASTKTCLLVKPDHSYYPIGYAYLITALNKHGISYDYYDSFLYGQPDMQHLLTEKKYDIVASGGMIGNINCFKQLFESVKAISPDIPCVLGGQITTDVKPEYLFDLFPVDYLVVGEGEITFPELISAIKNGKEAISEVKGIVYRVGEGTQKSIIKTPRRERLDLQSYNWMPTWDFLERDKYKYKTMPILSGRGCTGKCTFCSPTNGAFRGRKLGQIVEEIAMLNEKYDFVHFVFINEILFPDEDTIRLFCQVYKDIKPFKIWHGLLRMDVNPEILFVMRDAGCTLLNIGVESGSDRVLDNIKKGITTADTRRFVAAAKEAGIMLQASIMMGNCGELAEDIAMTVDLMLELNIHGAMRMTTNYPGTLNYVRALKRGLIDDEYDYLLSLEHIFSLRYYEVISEHLSGKINYLNLTELQTPELFRHVEIQMRRYYSKGYRIHEAKVAQLNDDKGVEIVGDCPYCGQEQRLVQRDDDPFPFFLKPMHCARCGAEALHFSAMVEPRTRAHLDSHKYDIATAKRVAVLGDDMEQLRLFFSFDHLGIDHDAFIGVVAHDNMLDGYCMNHPVLSFDKVIEQGADLLIVVGSVPDEIRSKMLVDEKYMKPLMVFLSPTHTDKLSFFKTMYTDLSIYKYAVDVVCGESSAAVEHHLLASAEKATSSDLLRIFSELEANIDSKFASANLPVQSTIELNLIEPFAGTGWGDAQRDVHGTTWRWLGPLGRASVYVSVVPRTGYLIKGLIHAALRGSQERLRVLVNGQEFKKTWIALEDGSSVYVNCLVPQEYVQQCDGRLKIEYRIVDAQSATQLFFIPHVFSLTKVRCIPQ